MGVFKMCTLRYWIVVAGCLGFASADSPFGFSLPAVMHVERNWFALPDDPLGTVVTRVHRERTGTQPVTFGLETSGPPAPFKIDSATGVVTVNDTLIDKENRSYSLWVTAYDGSIPQRTEVLATITDNNGQRPKLPHPPPFALPKYPINYKPNIPLPPKFTTTQITTKVTDDVTTPETTVAGADTTLNPPKRPADAPQVKEDHDKRPNTTTPQVDQQNNDVPLTVLPLVAIGGLVVIVAVVILFVWKKNSGQKKKSKKEDMSKDSSGMVLQDAASVWERPRAHSNRYESWDTSHLQLSTEETTTTKEEPADEWEFPRHRLRIFNVVGEGAFGQVWRAQAIDIDGTYVPVASCEQTLQRSFEQVRNETSTANIRLWEMPNFYCKNHFRIYPTGKKGEQTVAAKTLKENASEKEKSDLLQELAVMKSLGPHPNVVRLIACCTEKEPTLVIMEFVSLGKLQQFLRDSRAERHYGNTHGGSQFLTSRDLTHFAFQVARGMDFLSSKGIIHRDLAARNVLITEDRTCKVADFGFARDVAGVHVYERKSDGRLPIRWMAPESLYDDIFSVKSDIWSFGVLLWEIVTLGSTPYPGLSAGDVMKKVREGHRLEKPEHCRRELYNIMYYCWEAEATARPDFKECVAMLERLICTETDYIELERFPDHSYYNVQHLDGEKL